MRSRFCALIVGFVVFVLLCGINTMAQAAPAASNCLAVAEAEPPVVFASLKANVPQTKDVKLTFIGHSSFVIESPGGVRIVTDYYGYAGPGRVPDVVTMNYAHETHYTDHPDERIAHVLRGWNPKGGHAEHNLTVRDVYIRSVPTNIRSWHTEGTELFGNSIFIFEVAGLCIAHLGHLHHELTEQQLGQIGQLDVVLVPADGVWTMDHAGMAKVLRELRPALVIPMHYFGADALAPFLDILRPNFTVRISEVASTVVSRATLPKEPQVLVLPGY